MPQRFLLLGVIALLFTEASLTALQAETKGQEDLDQAIELQLTARTPADLERVSALCESAIKKGLEKDNENFAKQLLASTLFQVSRRLGTAVLAQQQPRNPRWQAMRKKALENLTKGFSYDKSNGDAYTLFARLHSLPGGNKEKAREAANQAIDLFEEDKRKKADALLLRAGLQTDNQKQLSDVDKAIETDPENVAGWQLRAIYYFQNNDIPKGITNLEKVLELDPKNVTALQQLATAYFSTEKEDQGREKLDQIVELQPEIGYPLRSRYFQSQGDITKAIDDLDTAIDLNPQRLDWVLMRADLYRRDRAFEKARNDVSRLLNRNPDLWQARYLRSQILADEGKLPAAISEMLSLVRGQTQNLSLRAELIQLYVRDNRPRKAVEECTKVLNSQAGHPTFLSMRATAYINIGKHALAIKDYDIALEKIPDSEHMLNNLSWILSTSKDDTLRDGKRALELGKRACEITDYKAAYILSTYAAGFAELGDWENATKWSTKAVELSRQDLTKASTPDDKKKQKETVDHLEQELESYKQKKPWREKQETKENTAPIRIGGGNPAT